MLPFCDSNQMRESLQLSENDQSQYEIKENPAGKKFLRMTLDWYLPTGNHTKRAPN